MSDFVAGDEPILYQVVNNGFRYITTDAPDGTESSCAEYRRADLPPTPAQIMADPRVKALVVAQDRIDSLSAQLAECEAQLLKVTAEREEENLKFQMANTAWDQETATRKVAEAQAATIKALVEALDRIAHASNVYGVEANAEDQGAETLAYAHKSTCNLARAALAALEPRDD